MVYLYMYKTLKSKSTEAIIPHYIKNKFHSRQYDDIISFDPGQKLLLGGCILNTTSGVIDRLIKLKSKTFHWESGCYRRAKKMKTLTNFIEDQVYN